MIPLYTWLPSKIPFEARLARMAASLSSQQVLSNMPDSARLRHRIYRLPGTCRLGSLNLLKVDLSIDLYELCHDYEVTPCVGKGERLFEVPDRVLHEFSVQTPMPNDYVTDAPWNEYPEDDQFAVQLDPGLLVTVLRTPGANAKQVENAIRQIGCTPQPATPDDELGITVFCYSSLECEQDMLIAQRCAGRELQPAAIVLTEYEDFFEYLHELRILEIQGTLAYVMHRDVYETMPVLIAGDPFLAEKLHKIMSSKIGIAQCNPLHED